MNRRATLALGFVAASAAVAGLWFGGNAVAQHMTQRRAAAAWAKLSRCLIGDAPLLADTPGERMRQIELGVAARRYAGARGPADEGWPARCAPLTEELDRAWQEARGDGDVVGRANQITLPLTILGAELRNGNAPTDNMIVFRLDALYKTASELHPRPGDAADVTPAPPPATPFRFSMELEPIVRKSDLLARTEPIAGRTLRAWFSDGGVCTLRGDGDPARALLSGDCRFVPPSIPQGSFRTLIGLDDGAPPMISVFDYERGGVYAAHGGAELLHAGTPTLEGAYGKANGFVATLDRTVRGAGGKVTFAPTYTLVRRAPDGKITRDQLDRPRADEHTDVQVVGEHLLWLEGTAGGERRLFARAVNEGAPPVGPIVEIGKVPAGIDLGRHARACRTPEAFFVELPGSGKRALIARAGDRWAGPLLVERGGDLSCSGGTATFTLAEPVGAAPHESYKEGALEITQTRCTLERCEVKSARPPLFTTRRDALENSKLAVTDLGGKVVLAWIDGAVFLRAAPLEELARAPVQVVMDATARKAGGSLVFGLHLFSRQDGAVLMLKHGDGVFALRFDASGKLTPVKPAP